MLAEVLDRLEEEGHRAAAVPVGRLDELREHYEELSGGGLLDRSLAEGLMKGLSLRPPKAIPHPKSLVVVATADPVVCCNFMWRGQDLTIPVPPTYLHLRRKSADVARRLAEMLPSRYHVECLINAPHKLLAVRSGLARYGRNNITYIPGLGSFYALTTVCTDVSCGEGDWVAPSLMSRCEGCSLCAAACPTGAIPEDRVLIRAELCITEWNERPGDVPFPGWLAESWHDSLVGCMHCQLACPENEAVRDYRELGPSFTEDETEALARAAKAGDLPGKLKEKLEEWDLLEWLGALPRNLAVHLAVADAGPTVQQRH